MRQYQPHKSLCGKACDSFMALLCIIRTRFMKAASAKYQKSNKIKSHHHGTNPWKRSHSGVISLIEAYCLFPLQKEGRTRRSFRSKYFQEGSGRYH